MKKTIVLCSGGIDSTTLLYLQRTKFSDSDILVLFFNYGQKSYEKEREALQKLVPNTIEIQEVNIVDVFKMSPSSLIKEGILPYNAVMKNNEINVTPNNITVEFRNGVFVSIAISIAQQRFMNDDVDIVLGTYYNNSNFFDCSEIFVKAYNSIAEYQSYKRHHVTAPLATSTKNEVFKMAKVLDVPLAHTWSCYLGKDTPCGYCAQCIDRLTLPKINEGKS